MWAYQTIVKTTIGFSPYQLVHGVESILPLECEIPSLKLAIEILPETSKLEKSLVHLDHLDEQHQYVVVALEINKRRIKAQYDKSIFPHRFNEGDLVLLYDQASKPLGEAKFNPMWHGPYVVKCVLKKDSYELEYYERNALVKSRNGLYIKK